MWHDSNNRVVFCDRNDNVLLVVVHNTGEVAHNIQEPELLQPEPVVVVAVVAMAVLVILQLP